MSAPRMPWEVRFAACQALGDHSLRMRKPGDWYVAQSAVERSDGKTLEGGCVTGAATPEEAVDQHWEWLTQIPSGKWLVIDAHRPTRRAVAWNGWMWAPFAEPQR